MNARQKASELFGEETTKWLTESIGLGDKFVACYSKVGWYNEDGFIFVLSRPPEFRHLDDGDILFFKIQDDGILQATTGLVTFCALQGGYLNAKYPGVARFSRPPDLIFPLRGPDG